MTWAPDYITSAEFKTDQGITDTNDDARIARDITAASRAVDRETRRQFGLVAAPESRLYTARWDDYRCRWVIPIDDLMTTTGFTVTVAAGAITDYTLKPANAAAEGKPWTLLVVGKDSTIKPTCEPDAVTLVGSWGWTAVPVVAKDATLLQTARFFVRKNSPYGVAGSPDIGSEIRLRDRVDPDVAVMLRSVIRWDRKRVTG